MSRLFTILLAGVIMPVSAVSQIPHRTLTAPTNHECAHPYFIEHSQIIDYDANSGGCCLWFVFRNCGDGYYGAGGNINVSDLDAGGSFHIFNSSIFPGCATFSSCGAIPEQQWEQSPATGTVQPGYTYIVYEPSNGHCSEGSLQFLLSRTTSCPPPCSGCSPFSPETGKEYIVSTWVHQDVDHDVITLEDPQVTVKSLGYTNNLLSSTSIGTVGYLIDGWQLMEGRILIHPGAAKLEIELGTTDEAAYYDDIRFFPADGSMKCYVYDPKNLRFVAELDERHFATFYEYDNEGRLMRVKKETERGRMTIQETQNNVHHAP